MTRCECVESHPHHRIVLTGGPGGGKSAVLALVKQSFCRHVKVLPEAASIVFGGGFPRSDHVGVQCAAQRAIFHVQRALEEAAEAEEPAITLCDRGTVDGAAYWSGPDDFWRSVGTTREQELRRYDLVIHIRTPTDSQGYNHQNPLRTESAFEASSIDKQIDIAWSDHPRRVSVANAADFLDKAAQVIAILRQEMPGCCRKHVVPQVDRRAGTITV